MIHEESSKEMILLIIILRTVDNKKLDGNDVLITVRMLMAPQPSCKPGIKMIPGLAIIQQSILVKRRNGVLFS